MTLLQHGGVWMVISVLALALIGFALTSGLGGINRRK
jgi:hypothetical protein